MALQVPSHLLALAAVAACLLSGCTAPASAPAVAPTPTVASYGNFLPPRPQGEPPVSLTGLSFLPDGHGWVATNDSDPTWAVLATTDDGHTWHPVAAIPGWLLQLHFSDDTHGWAISESGCAGSTCDGIDIYGTADGGVSWHRQWEGPWSTNQNNLLFFDDQSGFVMVNGGLLATTDGGKSWATSYTQPSDKPWELAPGSGAADFVDADHGWITYEDLSQVKHGLRTVDGGKTWSAVFGARFGFRGALQFINTQVGWINSGVGAMPHPGNLTITRDGGETWQQQDPDLLNSVRSADLVSPDEGWVITDSFSTTIALYHTTDGGKSWVEALTGASRPGSIKP